VSKFALTFIQEGNPTKPFSVKNKSTNSGPPAGLICVATANSTAAIFGKLNAPIAPAMNEPAPKAVVVKDAVELVSFNTNVALELKEESRSTMTRVRP
jgi:hypothetical protein